MIDLAIAHRMRFEEYKTLQQIGDYFKVSRERIRQVIGNSGTIAGTIRLRALSEHYQQRLYLNRDVTVDEIAAEFGLAPSTVRNVIGARHSYYRKIGKQRCSHCDQLKGVSEFHPRRNGFATCVCKPCNTTQCREDYQLNRAARLKTRHKWVEQNREKVREYAKKYYRKTHSV